MNKKAYYVIMCEKKAQLFVEALESVMCDVIKLRLKRRNATRSKIE